MKKIKLTNEQMEAIKSDAYVNGYKDGQENIPFTTKSSENDDEETNKKMTEEMSK